MITPQVKEFLSVANPEESVRSIPFEAGLKLLEEMVAGVEGGDLPLEDAIRSYERAAVLVAHLRAYLSGAEEKLRRLQRGSTGELTVSEAQPT